MVPQSQPAHPTQPIIVRIIEPPPAPQTTLQDVFVGSLAITLLAIALALVAGGVIGMLLVRWRKGHPPEADHLPPVSPQQAIGGNRRPTPLQ